MGKPLFLLGYLLFLLGALFNSESSLQAAQFPLDTSYKVDTVWATAYQATITLKNTTTSPTSSWTATFSLPSGYSLSPNISPGNVTVNGQNITVSNSANNGVIQAGASTSFSVLIVMPLNASTVLNNLQGLGEGSSTSPVIPAAPVLNAIQSTGNQSYTVSWKSVTNATSYLLQQSTTSQFTNPQTVAQGNVLSKAFTNQPNGTYFYRVAASNAAGQSSYSNIQSITISQTSPTLPAAPVLNAIQSTETKNYTVSWKSVANATSYLLQQSTNSQFTNPQTVAQGNVLSKAFTNQPNGTYFYRVAASNAAGQSSYSNIQSITISQTSPTLPAAPILNAIQSNGNQSYTVSWKSAATATSYLLQQDTTNQFTSPQTVAQGNILSKAFTNQSNGTYFYRVAASNAAGQSSYSNIQSITISQTPPSSLGVEHSAWYIDWTSWFTGPPFVIPTGVNMLNVFVGTLMYDANNNPTMGGFGNLTLPQLDAFTAYCAAQNPPIAVKVSIGGSGGMYDRCWDLLTVDNVSAFAQGMVDFCNDHGVVGVDFDYEAFVSSDQEKLVGTLIKEFKTRGPNLQTSYCSNAGFGPNYPWPQVAQNILDAATISPGKSALDRFYIMSYYNPLADEQNWIMGWADWLATNYGFTPERISVGIDDFDAHAYDPIVFYNWAVSMGFSTAHWAFDPARPKSLNPPQSN